MNDDDQNDDFLVNNPADVNPLYEMKQNEKLEEDNDTPFADPDDVTDNLGDTHQQADTNVDPMEKYNEGIEGATEATPPSSATENDSEQ